MVAKNSKMTIKQRQYFQNASHHKKTGVFEYRKEKLIEASPEKLLVQRSWRMKQCHEGADQKGVDVRAIKSQTAVDSFSPGSEARGQIEDERVCPMEEKDLVKGKSTEGDDNRLLILANYAELMSESGNNLHTVYQGSDSIIEAQHLQENVNDVVATDDGTVVNQLDKNLDKDDEVPPILLEINAKDGTHCEGKFPRLSQIRRQARLKSQSFVQQGIQEEPCSSLQGSITRLTQIRHQARLVNHVSVQDDFAGCSQGKLVGGITRLSHIRRQARSKTIWPPEEGNSEHMHRHLDCHSQ